MSVSALTAVRLVTTKAARLARFYADAFGFVADAAPDADPQVEAELLGFSGAVERHPLRLGQQVLELLQITPPGAPYPRNDAAPDAIFQHVALVVPDMAAALARLAEVGGTTAISHGGPQTLPASSGGVTAYKFRDLEGHPLELLQFPPETTPSAWSYGKGICLGYDHSAIVIADLDASLRFYGSLGLTLTGRSVNRGLEQAKLDGVPDPVVDVVTLSPRGLTPHVELLHYRGGTRRTATAASDIAATQLAFHVEHGRDLDDLVDMLASHLASPGIVDPGNGPAALLRDPDGHRVLLRSPRL